MQSSENYIYLSIHKRASTIVTYFSWELNPGPVGQQPIELIICPEEGKELANQTEGLPIPRSLPKQRHCMFWLQAFIRAMYSYMIKHIENTLCELQKHVKQNGYISIHIQIMK